MFRDLAGQIVNNDYLIPVFDMTNWRGGNNTKFHLVGLAWFRITNININCAPIQGQEQHWSMSGRYIQRYAEGSAVRHGDVRRSSHPIVFLEP